MTGDPAAARKVVVRPRDKLREEIRAAKRRRKEEKRKYKEERGRGEEGVDITKLNAKLEKLQSKMSKSSGDHTGRGEEGVDITKLNAKLEKLQSKMSRAEEKTEYVLPQVTFEGPKNSGDHTTRK